MGCVDIYEHWGVLINIGMLMVWLFVVWVVGWLGCSATAQFDLTA
nr:MAG TPA: hypothetical protein [Caudoviricetes sp.]